MTLEELRAALLTVDPSVVLVPSRLLGRVIQQVYRLPTHYLKVPHRESLLINRQLLYQHIEQDELNLEAERLLPPTVILLAQPSAEALHRLGRDATVLKTWRRLFHASAHRTLERKLASVTLPADAIRSRIEQIGPVEFAEIRAVLEQEHYLFPGADDRQAYVEFAAVYLELRYFLNNLLAVYFPGIGDFQKIDQVLAQDINGAALFAATRLTDAPDPVARTDQNSDEPVDAYWKYMRRAEKAAQSGNTVRAAVFHTQAADRAPSALVPSARSAAADDLQQLITRLQPALKLTEGEVQEWRKHLPALLERTDQGHWTPEARLLYDLQKVCVDHERDIYALDLVEWGLSGGHRPIRRPLPGQRVVRITLHLRSAARRLTMARVSDGDRQQLARLLQTALQQSEIRLRGRFRPVLNDALHDVGLQAGNPPEHTAFHKMVEELLDRITAYGFLTFSDLRDTISRNNLKLADIADPQEFVRGDPLIRLDRRLATALDGVYRPSEFYLRWLERLTSLGFGTRLGRAFTRYVLVPFGAALVLIEGVQLLLSEIKDLHAPIFGPLSLLIALFIHSEEPHQLRPVLGITLFLVLGSFLFGLIHRESLRRRCRQALTQVYRAGRTLLVDVPVRLLPLPAIRRVWRSWPFQLFYWYLFKPLLVCGLIALFFPNARHALTAGAIFLFATIVLNSRLGVGVSGFLIQAVVQFTNWLRAGLLENLLRLIVRVFKQVTDAVEYVLYTVDEWLRFRSGDTWLSMTLRAVLGVVWFPVSYVARLYIVVLLEPGFNPLKAPISIVAAKFVYPITLAFRVVPLMTGLLDPVFGSLLAHAISFSTWWLLPDAFGFLFWETKENWSLYRANRPANLRPVAIGHHGETMRQLLQRSFHSGTLPKLFARLRDAERTAYESGTWRSARAYRATLHEIEKALRLFLQRELLMLLRQSHGWPNHPLNVAGIALASNRIGIELDHNDFPQVPLRVEFALEAGWLVAGITDPAWLARIRPGQFRALARALGGLYKSTGVTLVREQITANLPAEANHHAITAQDLLVWVEACKETPVKYDLKAEQRELPPQHPDAAVRQRMPVLDALQLIYGRMPISWQQWVDSWERDLGDKEDLPLSGPLAVQLAQSITRRPAVPTDDASAAAPARLAPADGLPRVVDPISTVDPGPVEQPGPVRLLAAVEAAEHGVPAPVDTGAVPTPTLARPPEAASPSSSPLAERDPHFETLPALFGRYRVLKQLGEGGMGTVYLADDTTLDRKVALKIARGRAQGGSEGTARFLREARAAAALQNEGICRVLDYGTIDGTHFLTMEYIEGEPLSRLAAKGQPLAQRRAAGLIYRVALALAEAHRQGVIHRDLKPANIMLDDRDRPKVVDFGLARREQDTTLTGQGIILGTPAYMSPEQVCGQSVGPASDIYSLGVILYQLLTGRLPFEGTLTQLTYLIVHQEPEPASVYRPELDSRLAAVCSKAMAKEITDRYATMAELADALAGYLNAGMPDAG